MGVGGHKFLCWKCSFSSFFLMYLLRWEFHLTMVLETFKRGFISNYPFPDYQRNFLYWKMKFFWILFCLINLSNFGFLSEKFFYWGNGSGCSRELGERCLGMCFLWQVKFFMNGRMIGHEFVARGGRTKLKLRMKNFLFAIIL